MNSGFRRRNINTVSRRNLEYERRRSNAASPRRAAKPSTCNLLSPVARTISLDLQDTESNRGFCQVDLFQEVAGPPHVTLLSPAVAADKLWSVRPANILQPFSEKLSERGLTNHPAPA
jgi:hypothetical protein